MIARRLRAFAAFWYDFLIGDDWRLAAGVALALAGTALLAHVAAVPAWWLVPATLPPLLLWSLRRAIRPSASQSPPDSSA